MQDTVVKIGETVRVWRMRREMTQLQLAKRAGISPSTLSLIERDEVDPYPATIGKLSRALGIDPEELVKHP